MKRFLDYFILPLFIFIFLFEPNFLHGYIFSFDEGQHLAWINGILHGKIPYRDMYMIYGPLLEYIPAFLMKIFGISIAVLRTFYHLGTIISLVLGYFLARVMIKTRLFLYLSTWLLITLTVMPMWSSRWGGIRIGAGLLALLGLVKYLKNKDLRFLYLTGLMTGISYLISQEIGLSVIISCFFTLIGYNYLQGSITRFFKEFSLYISGILTIAMPIFIYFLYKGALPSYLRIMFVDVPMRFPVIYKDDYPFLTFSSSFSLVAWISYLTSRTFLFYESILIYILGIFYLIKQIIRRRFGFDDIYLLILISFGIPMFKAATRMLGGPQFNISLPPVIMVSFIFAERIFFNIKDIVKGDSVSNRSATGRNNPCPCGSGRKYKNCCLGKRNSLALMSIMKLSFLTLILVFIGIHIHILTRPDINIPRMISKFKTYSMERTGLKPLQIEGGKGVYIPAQQADLINSVVHYLEGKIPLDQPFFAAPHEAHYYFFLNRKGATRFDSALFAEVSPNYQEEVIEDLEETKPIYILYAKDSYLVTDHNPVPNEKRIPKIVDYLQKNYALDNQFGGTFILKRID